MGDCREDSDCQPDERCDIDSCLCIPIDCGDGHLDPEEECDDGNTDDCDGCDSGCVVEECGNGKLQCGEECDPPHDAACPGECQPDCSCDGTCGNGTCDPGEDCNTCPEDCDADCGNRVCEDQGSCGEDQDNCCDDCGCPTGYRCAGGECVRDSGGACCLDGADPYTCDNPGTCGDFEVCMDDPNCVCGTLAEGGGRCLEGGMCDALIPCPDGSSDCPVDQYCYVDTCCDGPVCAYDCGTGPCGPECDFCWFGTEYEENCPLEWCGTFDGCDCGCQFSDEDCPGGGPCPIGGSSGATTSYEKSLLAGRTLIGSVTPALTTASEVVCIEDVTAAACSDMGGDYQGDGTDCADADGDGTADVCVPGDCEDAPYTIGGAIYSDCEEPLTAGVAGVTVCVDCTCDSFHACTESSGEQGIWEIPDVPCCHECTVEAERGCFVDDECPPEPCQSVASLIVDDQHQAGNQSLQFYDVGCTVGDMNCDGFCSIIGDVPPFVDCVYFGDCSCPDCDPSYDCECAADCNCDGFPSIIGDVPCFVEAVYFQGTCPDPCDGREATGAPGGRSGGEFFTIGGAVYADESMPLSSGVNGITVRVFDGTGMLVGYSATEGSLGVWRIEDLPPGRYRVAFFADDEAGEPLHRTEIVVDEANKASNQSIQWLHEPEDLTPSGLDWPSRPPARIEN